MTLRGSRAKGLTVLLIDSFKFLRCMFFESCEFLYLGYALKLGYSETAFPKSHAADCKFQKQSTKKRLYGEIILETWHPITSLLYI